MGTSSTGITSAALASFNGTSTYAADLQQAINQAVTIASIPLSQLQNNVASLQSESGELGVLQNNFTNLQTAIQQLSSASGGNAMAASASNGSVASVSVDSSQSPTPGTYDLNVISPGSETSTISNNGLPVVSDPSSSSISSSSSFTLTVGSSHFNINPSANTLNSLAAAINSANAGVTATIVNIGPPTSPDYRLSVQSTSLGSETIQLNDGHDLLGVLSAGSSAEYQVDGQPASPSFITSNSANVTIAPGVTATLLLAGDTTVTVAPDSSAAANALSAFANTYNSTLGQLNLNHGSGGGALTGQSVVLQLEQSLGHVIQYSGSGGGSVNSLAELGLTFNSQGQMVFDEATFDSADSNNANGVAAFLGSATGGGFLGNAAAVLNGLEQANTGLFAEGQSSYTQQITADNSEITQTQTRITAMQNSLTAQMTQADTMIASLESQVTYFTTLFSDTQNALQGK